MPTKNSKALRVLVDYADLEATGFLGDDRYAVVAHRPPTGSVLRSAG